MRGSYSPLPTQLQRGLFAQVVGSQPVLGKPIIKFVSQEWGCQGRHGLPLTVNHSEILGRSEPLMNPMVTSFYNSDRSSSIMGNMLYTVQIIKKLPTRKQQLGGGCFYLAGMRVPSILNKTIR